MYVRKKFMKSSARKVLLKEGCNLRLQLRAGESIPQFRKEVCHRSPVCDVRHGIVERVISGRMPRRQFSEEAPPMNPRGLEGPVSFQTSQLKSGRRCDKRFIGLRTASLKR